MQAKRKKGQKTSFCISFLCAYKHNGVFNTIKTWNCIKYNYQSLTMEVPLTLAIS